MSAYERAPPEKLLRSLPHRYPLLGGDEGHRHNGCATLAPFSGDAQLRARRGQIRRHPAEANVLLEARRVDRGRDLADRLRTPVAERVPLDEVECREGRAVDLDAHDPPRDARS